ncbi:MAG: hypothetical protein ACPGTU_08170 [Myxococcota bacterium]
MSHGPDFTPVIETSPRSLPPKLALRCSLALAAGIFGAHWTYSQWPDRAMGAFLQNIIFWLGVAQGGFMLSVTLTLTKGRWGRSLKRISEAFAIMVPVLYIGLLCFLWLGGMEIFPWMHEDLPAHKAVYLTEPFFFTRQVVGLGILILLNWLYIKASWRPDLGMMSEKLGDQAPEWWGRFTKDWKGLEAEVEISETKQRKYAAMIAVAYSLIFSMVAVDLEMSLAPHWFANMFPAWFFVSSFWSGLVGIAIYSLLAGKWLKIDGLATPTVYHDLGKLIFACCMFWAYTTYAQYLAIWYGNMTEEIGFILIRTELEPWATLSKVVVLCCFLVPWTLLLSRSMKKIRSSFLAVSFLIFLGIWLERFLVTMPSIWKGEELPIGLGELLMPLGFGGTMVLLVSAILSKIPSAPVTDKMAQPNDLEVHVYPSSGHAASH